MIDFWDDEVIHRTCRFISEMKSGRDCFGNETAPEILINGYLKWLDIRQKNS